MDTSKPLIPKYILDSLLEFIVTMLFSLLPIIVGAFLIYGTKNQVTTFAQALSFQLNGGELFLWSITLLAGVAYSTYKNPPIQFRTFFGLYCTCMLCISVSYKAIITLGEPQASFITISYWLGPLSAVVLLANMYVNHKAHNVAAPALQRQQVAKFQDGFDSYMDDLS